MNVYIYIHQMLANEAYDIVHHRVYKYIIKYMIHSLSDDTFLVVPYMYIYIHITESEYMMHGLIYDKYPLTKRTI